MTENKAFYADIQTLSRCDSVAASAASTQSLPDRRLPQEPYPPFLLQEARTHNAGTPILLYPTLP
jgi:hypothetical protein